KQTFFYAAADTVGENRMLLAVETADQPIDRGYLRSGEGVVDDHLRHFSQWLEQLNVGIEPIVKSADRLAAVAKLAVPIDRLADRIFDRRAEQLLLAAEVIIMRAMLMPQAPAISRTVTLVKSRRAKRSSDVARIASVRAAVERRWREPRPALFSDCVTDPCRAISSAAPWIAIARKSRIVERRPHDSDYSASEIPPHRLP